LIKITGYVNIFLFFDNLIGRKKKMNIITEIEKIIKNQFPECSTFTANFIANEIMDRVDFPENFEKKTEQ